MIEPDPADYEACLYCGAAWSESFDDNWGSRYACGTTVTFIDGMGLVWNRKPACKGHPVYPGCWRPCKLYRGVLGWQHAHGCPNAGFKRDEHGVWVPNT